MFHDLIRYIPCMWGKCTFKSLWNSLHYKVKEEKSDDNVPKWGKQKLPLFSNDMIVSIGESS